MNTYLLHRCCRIVATYRLQDGTMLRNCHRRISTSRSDGLTHPVHPERQRINSLGNVTIATVFEDGFVKGPVIFKILPKVLMSLLITRLQQPSCGSLMIPKCLLQIREKLVDMMHSALHGARFQHQSGVGELRHLFLGHQRRNPVPASSCSSYQAGRFQPGQCLSNWCGRDPQRLGKPINRQRSTRLQCAPCEHVHERVVNIIGQSLGANRI